jgi:lipid A 3-O-deacylase
MDCRSPSRLRARRHARVVAAALCGTFVLAGRSHALTAGNERPTWAPRSVFAQVGTTDHAHTMVIGATWPWSWRREFAGGTLTAYSEAAFGRWNSELDDRGHASAWLTQLAWTPVLRWQSSPAPQHGFIEVGIGVNALLPIYRNGDRRFSTTLNFGDHVAAGLRFGDGGRQEVSLRLQHFSNAGIKKPNPGEGFVQLRYAFAY